MKIGALVPVRLGSERLPGKALIQFAGRPALWHLLDRIAATRLVNVGDIVVCTTQDDDDDTLAEAVSAYGASCFRGSRDDIIDRFHRAAESYEFDAVIQANGDNPLTDTGYMGLTMERLLSAPELDIVTCEGLPIGTGSCSFRRRALDKVHRHYRSPQNDTGFIYYFTRTGLCTQESVAPVSADHVMPEARLTLDYPQDAEVFATIFESLYRQGETFDLRCVLEFLRAHPKLAVKNNYLQAAYIERTRQKLHLSYAAADGEELFIND